MTGKRRNPITKEGNMNIWDKNIKLTMDDMPNGDLMLVAENCGIEVATKLMLNLQGVTINVPRGAMRKVVSRYICEHYNGSNIKQLALECHVSIRHVYGVLQKNKNAFPGSPARS